MFPNRLLKVLILPFRKIKIVFSKQILGLIFIFSVFICSYYESFLNFVSNIRNSTASGKDTPKLPLTIHCNIGRLGNQMNSYATLFGLSILNNRVPVTPPCINSLHKYFNLSAKTLNEDDFKKYSNEYEIAGYLREQDLSIPQNCNIIAGVRYPESHTFYDQFRDQIKMEFTFKPHIIKYAQNVLNNAKKRNNYTVFVGIHVRRRDFYFVLRRNHNKEANVRYFVQAMNYFRKYQGVTFVVVSDDHKWCRDNIGNFSDVYLAPLPPEPGYDMAILAECNHTIMTYGTFGYWGAYLAGGETVYFANNFIQISYNVSYLPYWIGISPT